MGSVNYAAVVFDVDGYDPEILMAFLGEWPFDSFHEEESRVTAYIRQDALDAALHAFLETLPGSRVKAYHVEDVPDVNWNARWEESFQPVPVDDDYYIRAAFHAPPPPGRYRHEIVIAPRMAFGTGHHATTYMMLQAMARIPMNGLDVLDFGCGTGILAVAAALQGAVNVFGNDIQPEAMENCIEHARMNGVGNACTFALGGHELVSGKFFDVILANINTWVIADAADTLFVALRPDGWLLLSGILARDADRISDLFRTMGLAEEERRTRDGWVQLSMRRPA
jgi:ribosomal protein L11 methyltransferase